MKRILHCLLRYFIQKNKVSIFKLALEKSSSFVSGTIFFFCKIFLQRSFQGNNLSYLTFLLRLKVKGNNVCFCVHFVLVSNSRIANMLGGSVKVTYINEKFNLVQYTCFGASKYFGFCVINVSRYRSNLTLFTVVVTKYLIKQLPIIQAYKRNAYRYFQETLIIQI